MDNDDCCRRRLDPESAFQPAPSAANRTSPLADGEDRLCCRLDGEEGTSRCGRPEEEGLAVPKRGGCARDDAAVIDVVVVPNDGLPVSSNVNCKWEACGRGGLAAWEQFDGNGNGNPSNEEGEGLDGTEILEAAFFFAGVSPDGRGLASWSLRWDDRRSKGAVTAKGGSATLEGLTLEGLTLEGPTSEGPTSEAEEGNPSCCCCSNKVRVAGGSVTAKEGDDRDSPLRSF